VNSRVGERQDVGFQLWEVIVARSCVEREVGYEGTGCDRGEARVLMRISAWTGRVFLRGCRLRRRLPIGVMLFHVQPNDN
jgi:hypothetical protein